MVHVRTDGVSQALVFERSAAGGLGGGVCRAHADHCVRGVVWSVEEFPRVHAVAESASDYVYSDMEIAGDRVRPARKPQAFAGGICATGGIWGHLYWRDGWIGGVEAGDATASNELHWMAVAG